MADDNRIEIVASLDIPKSVSTIKKDLETVKKQLDADKALSITCSIDENSIRNIQSQLNKMSEQLKVNVPKIELNADGSKAGQSAEALSKGLEHANENARTLKRTLADLEDKYTKPFKAVFNTDGLIDAERTLSKIESRLSALGSVSVTGKYGDGASADSLERITAEIKASSGEVRTLNFLLDETDDKFKLLNSTFSDKGVGKVQQDIARLSKEIANFEASHRAIESGLVEPLTAARNAIIDLESGVGSVETAQKALDNLKTKAAEIGTSLKSTGSSFNIFDNAINKAENFDNVIKALQSDIDALSSTDAKSTLGNSLASAAKSLAELQQIGETSGKGLEWSKKYNEVSTSIQTITNELKAAQKAEKALIKDTALDTKIRKLAADVEIYAQANERAVSSAKKMSDNVSFADRWADITSRMAKGANLTDSELKKLSGDMAVFKKEAQSAGLAGETAFGKFLNTFKVLTAYVSASRVFTMAMGKIRSAVDELKNIDDILTEISKTSDRTAESLRKLGENSFDVASKYGRTASDYLLGVQEMSRAGFSEFQSESLAEVSLMAQAAGDMTAEMANEYIIATNAAYGLKGSEESLNQVLDSQNYITNRNAVNMENLAEATKVAASQASASGVAIDELTAAVGTMVATTQQGGNVAGRAFKGILMNLQQVKASASEIGDGDADITAESLTKYEAAVNALGVSLKEVRNGAVQLRSPMEVLKELSIAVKNEAEGSIKVANLVNAIGGKFRGNQLIALLQNWETYEKMLSEFNSEQAVGSAMKEAEKSANNWTGSINKLKNSWSELINQFVNSDAAINVINTLNDIIQNLTSSSVSETLGTVAKLVTDLVEAFGKISSTIGIIPTVLGLIATFKGENIKSLVTSFYDLITAEETATIATNGLKTALNAIGNIAFFWGISKVIELFRSLKQEAEEAERRQEQAQQAVIDNYKTYQQEEAKVNDLVQQYVKLSSVTQDLTAEKNALLDIQEKLNETIDDQTNKVDTLNNSLAENITLLQRQKLEEAEATVRNTKGQAENAQTALDAAYEALWTDGNKDLAKAYDAVSMITGIQIRGTLKEQSDLLQEMIDAYGKIDGYNTKYYNSLVEQKNVIDERIEGLQTVVKVYEEAQKTIENLSLPVEKQEQFNKLIEEASDKVRTFANTDDALVKYGVSQELENIHNQLIALAGDNMELKQVMNTAWVSFDETLNRSTGSLENLREAWFESLEEMQKGALKTADSMVEALGTIAGGEGLSSEDFWNLMELDTNKILTDISMVGDKFVVSQEQLLKLKDQYIQSQIDSIAKDNDELLINKQKEESLIRQYELVIERWSFEQKNLNNPKYRNEYDNVVNKLAEAKSKTEDYGEQIRRNNILIAEWRSRLGLVANTQEAITKQIENLNKVADNLLKAQETKIDQIVDSHESEKEVLENEKALLEKELQTLEDQKSEIEDIISNYESVNKLVQDTVQKEIDALEEQKKAIEDTYSKRIDALKAENEERSDALEYAQKLANLENAKNNKRRVYDEARGWRYESVKEDVVKAENDLAEFENSQAIKQLEKERDREVAAIDDIIDTKKEYSEAWAEILDSIQSEEDELLAAEILGADWREKIASGDIDIMNKFRNEYRNHNTALQQLTKTEIKLKEEAIKAKDAEIKSKQEQIDAWKKYKKEVQDTANAIKNANAEYMDSLDKVALKESDGFDERENNLRSFANEYGSMMSQINYWQEQLDNGAGDYDFNLHVNGLWELEEAVRYVKELGIEYNAAAIGKYLFDNSKDMDRDDARKMLMAYADASTNMRGYSSGGVADYTGVAMLHGRKNAPETIFNAADSAKLYDLVHNTPNLMADMINQATKMSGFNLTNSNASTNTANTISVSIGTIYANNPSELTTNLDKHLDQYFTKKLTQSYTGKQ